MVKGSIGNCFVILICKAEWPDAWINSVAGRFNNIRLAKERKLVWYICIATGKNKCHTYNADVF